MSGCGCACAGTGSGICPCEDVHGPWWPYNPSGLGQIAYRVGDFGSFRQELLRHLPGEQALAAWRPTTSTDLALQAVDWFSIVADILTFYNERIANEAYLGTAQLPSSVQRLVELLGYRPRPGIGALATLAVLASRPGPVIIPDRFAISSKALPGLESQTFELTSGTTFAEPTSVAIPPPDELSSTPTLTGPPPGSPPGAAEPPAHKELIAHGGVLVKGKPSSVSVGDELLLIGGSWPTAGSAAIVTVSALVSEPDPHGRPNTRVLLKSLPALAGTPMAGDFRLQRATRANHLITAPSGTAPISSSTIYLDATARWIKSGDPLAIEAPGATGPDLAQVKAYAELLWYANGSSSTPPAAPSSSPIPLMVAELSVLVPSGANLQSKYGGANLTSVTILSGWTDVGTLLDTPYTTVSGLSRLTLARAPSAPAGVAAQALVEDSLGQGSAVTATPKAGSSDIDISTAGAGQLPTLSPPLRVLWDLITVTRGASVRGEQLGLGDATKAGQDFTLSRSPVTYLADGSPGSPGASRSGEGYSSTIELIAAGIYYTEVPTLYGHGPGELIFSTYEDPNGQTHVVTGDGLAGARLPTGAAVSANYRIGSGASAPPVTALTQVLSPATNLRGVRNPVPAGGGADPDPPSLLREYAPKSVLTFDRAVSGDDYETVAALAPGVTRASAVWSWDPGEQRAVVCVYVGDDDAAVTSARAALRQQADPNRPIVVLAATPVDIVVGLTIRVDSSYVAADVKAAVRSALLDGLFAPGGLAISEVLYRSRVEAACALPGVLAVHELRLSWTIEIPIFVVFGLVVDFPWPESSNGPRFEPGEGCFFRLADGDLHVDVEQA